MTNADLYQIHELPPDEIGGGSGDKRKFLLQFIGKSPNEQFPYTVANETVSSFLASVLGFTVPIVVPHTIDGLHQALVLWMNPAAQRQQGPPMSSKALQEFLDTHAKEIHGAIVLDLFLANTDRAFGPERRNIATDDQGNLVLFDFGNALFYRERPHAGIVAGILRLDSVENDMAAMFDKQEPSAESYYFQLLTDQTLVRFWCDRISQLPKFVLENAVQRIPKTIEPPNLDERNHVVEFLERRKSYLFSHITNTRGLFPNLDRG